MALGDAAPAAALEHGMDGDEPAVLEDPDLGGGDLNLDGTPAGAVGDGVEIAADRDHALVGDPPLEAEDGVERPGRQRLESRLLLGEVLDDNAPGGAVQAAVGDLVEPLGELGVQVTQVAESPGQEEVLADIAERPLDFALGLGAVGPAGLGQVAVVTCQSEELVVVDDAALVDLAEDRGAHPIVEDLLRYAAKRVEGGDMAAQHGGEVLLGDEAGPHHAAVAEHEGEQPDDALGAGLVLEADPEVGEVDLRLAPWRGLEAPLKGGFGGRPDGAQEVGHGGVAAGEAKVTDLAPEPSAGQVGEAADALAEERLERAERRRGWLTRLVGWRLQAARDVGADGLAVAAGTTSDGRDAEALPGEVQDHDELPKGDHRLLP